ncbi:hypothetical protein T06_1344 [Trichinella sp. T6]|nr:hypothetical protein T06_1344 [Trichinella sp. T6]
MRYMDIRGCISAGWHERQSVCLSGGSNRGRGLSTVGLSRPEALPPKNRFLPHKPTQLLIFWLTADLQIHLFDVRLYPDSGWTKAEEDCDLMRL